jgi:hypothetical protein
MSVLRSFFVLVIAVVAVPVMAVPGDWMPEAKKIAQIVVEGADTGGALIVIEGGVQPESIPPACNSQYNTIYLNTDKGKAVYSMALSAYLAGKPVKLALSCTGGRPLITHILF